MSLLRKNIYLMSPLSANICMRRTCCLGYDICKWLNILVLSDKDKKPHALSPASSFLAKSREFSSLYCDLALLLFIQAPI